MGISSLISQGPSYSLNCKWYSSQQNTIYPQYITYHSIPRYKTVCHSSWVLHGLKYCYSASTASDIAITVYMPSLKFSPPAWERDIINSGMYLNYLIFFFLRFWNPKHFTGIKICNFNATMQTAALPHTRAQWGTRKLPKKIYAASTIDQLMATATNLSLSFLCSLREYHDSTWGTSYRSWKK